MSETFIKLRKESHRLLAAKERRDGDTLCVPAVRMSVLCRLLRAVLTLSLCVCALCVCVATEGEKRDVRSPLSV